MKMIAGEKRIHHGLSTAGWTLALTLCCIASQATAAEEQDVISTIIEAADIELPPLAALVTEGAGSRLSHLESRLESLKLAAQRIAAPYRFLGRLQLLQLECDELGKDLRIGVASPDALKRLHELRLNLFSFGLDLQQRLQSEDVAASELALAEKRFDEIGGFFASDGIAPELDASLIEATEKALNCSRHDMGECRPPEQPLNRRHQSLMPVEKMNSQYRFLAQTVWRHQNVIRNRWQSPAVRTRELARVARATMDPRSQQDQRLLDDFRTTLKNKGTLDKQDTRRLMARASMPAYFENSALHKKWLPFLANSSIISGLFSYDEQPGFAIKLCSELDQHLLALQALDAEILEAKEKLAGILAAYEINPDVSILRSASAIMDIISFKLAEKSRLGLVSQTETDRLTTVSWPDLARKTKVSDQEIVTYSLVYASIDGHYWTRDMPFPMRALMPALKDLQIDGLSLLDGEAVPAFTESVAQLQWWQSPYSACGHESPATLILEMRSSENTDYLVLAR